MSIWKSLSKIEIRQLAAIPYLYLIFGFAATAQPPVNILNDLDGTAGFLLVFAPMLLFPRKWLPIAYIIAAIYFLIGPVLAVQMLFTETTWKHWLFPFASLLASGIFVSCAVITWRRNQLSAY